MLRGSVRASGPQMMNMFKQAKKFDGDLSKWNVGKVVNMQGMFHAAEAFEGGDLSKWDTGKVRELFWSLEITRSSQIR